MAQPVANAGGRTHTVLGPARVRLATGIALCAYVAIFPGFYAYHMVVSQALLPPVLRGYSVAVAVLLLPTLAIAYGISVRRISPLDALFFGFVAFVAVMALVGHADAADPTIVASYLAVVPQWAALYLTARLLDVEARSAKVVLRASFVSMVAIIAANASEGSFLLAARQSAIDDRESLATYQDFALLLLVSLTLCAAGQGSLVWRIATYTITLAALFLTGARSEFLALFFVAFVIEWSRSRHRWLVPALAATAVAGVAVAVQALVFLLPENRVIDLITNRAEGSLTQRREMLEAALHTLRDHPLAGSFASYPPGEYAHNLLSVWVDFGVVGLFWLLALVLWSLLVLVGRQRVDRRGADYLSAVGLLVAAVVLLLLAKSFTYPLLPFAIGLSVGLQERRRARRLRGRAPRAVPAGLTATGCPS